MKPEGSVLSYQPGEITPTQAVWIRDTLAIWAEREAEEVVERSQWRGVEAARLSLFVQQLAAIFRESTCLIWDREMMNAALAGQGAFQDTPLAAGLAPIRPQLWFLRGHIYGHAEDHAFFEVPSHTECDMLLVRRIRGVATDRVEQEIHAGWVPMDAFTGRTGLGVTLIFNPLFDHPVPYADRPQTLPYLRQLPPLYEGEAVKWAHMPEVAGLSFLALPFVETAEVNKPSRQVRRAAERDKRPLPEVREVVLRRKEPLPTEGSEAAQYGESGREYQCRWLVGAHWRRRAARWGKGEGPIYVSPYVKGPTDKPFRAARETVYVAKR